MVLHSRGCGRVARRRILSSDLLVESLTGFPEGPFRIPLGVPVGRSAQGTPFLYPNGCFPPPIGGFWTPEGPWAGGSLHPLGVLFRWEARGREDCSSHWEFQDAEGSQEFQGELLALIRWLNRLKNYALFRTQTLRRIEQNHVSRQSDSPAGRRPKLA